MILLLVDLGTVWKAHSASTEASATVESVRTTEAVRYQIMLNRLNLNNFLLSGDPRDEEKVNHGFSELNDLIKRGQAQTSNEFIHNALIQVESTEASWADNFAKPLLAKRHQVDSGDATVSDLQIFYLQKDPASWLTKSSSVLDQANADISKALTESERVAYRAGNFSYAFIILGTIGAMFFIGFTGIRTANSITEPLQHLITVAREIGDSVILTRTSTSIATTKSAPSPPPSTTWLLT